MRARVKANVVIQNGSTNKDVLFGPDDVAAEAVLDGFTEAVSGTVKLTANTAFTIPFGAIAQVRGLYLRVDGGDASLVLNGAAALSLMRGATGTGGTQATSARMLLEALLSSAVLTAGIAPITLTHCAWGDPVA
jgi:hypothetical protein